MVAPRRHDLAAAAEKEKVEPVILERNVFDFARQKSFFVRAERRGQRGERSNRRLPPTFPKEVAPAF